MGFFISFSDKYFSRIEPPTECPTNKTFPRSRDNSAEIFRFQDLTFGSASSGIRGKCTSYSPPSARPRDAASAASSLYAPLPPPCKNSTSVLVICVSQVQSLPQLIVTCRRTFDMREGLGRMCWRSITCGELAELRHREEWP